MLSKNPSGHDEAFTGTSSTPSPKRRIETSLPSNRSSFGILTACDRPLVNKVVVIAGIYPLDCSRSTINPWTQKPFPSGWNPSSHSLCLNLRLPDLFREFEELFRILLVAIRITVRHVPATARISHPFPPPAVSASKTPDGPPPASGCPRNGRWPERCRGRC